MAERKPPHPPDQAHLPDGQAAHDVADDAPAHGRSGHGAGSVLRHLQREMQTKVPPPEHNSILGPLPDH